MTTNISQLCSVEELKPVLDSQNICVIDASWYMPAQNVDCFAQFQAERIKGAQFFDIDQVCDISSTLPHMLPSTSQFSESVTNMGVNNETAIVVYDSAGLFSAARVWWMFKVFGHKNIRVLNGGLPAWIASGGETESGGETRTKEPQSNKHRLEIYKANINETFLANKDVLIRNCQSGEYMVLDARSKGRFSGAQPEPRAGLPSGHMPHSKSLPFDLLVDDGYLKPESSLRSVFAEYGLDAKIDQQALITSCGSGITAAIISLALVEAGFAMHKLYDGAWSEWASSDDTVVLQGE